MSSAGSSGETNCAYFGQKNATRGLMTSLYARARFHLNFKRQSLYISLCLVTSPSRRDRLGRSMILE
jgi:hypothetical protein